MSRNKQMEALAQAGNPLQETIEQVIIEQSDMIDRALGDAQRHRYDLSNGTSIFLKRMKDGTREIIEYGPFGTENRVEMRPALPSVDGVLSNQNSSTDTVLWKSKDLLARIKGLQPTFHR